MNVVLADIEKIGLDGVAAPPMANGELVFEAPWQGRAFGMANTLVSAGVFTWDEFRAALIARIAAWERAAPPGATYPYYDCFLAALEGLLVERGIVAPDALEARTEAIEARGDGHDHPHDHPQDHGDRHH